MLTSSGKLNTITGIKRLFWTVVAMLVAGVLPSIVCVSASAQPLESDLGIDLENPDFLREFNGSFEVGLRAGAPAMNERESVIISVVSERYRESIDAALDFILDEVRIEERRVEIDQRYRQSLESDYVYSANIEYAIGQLYQLKGNRILAERYYLQAIEKFPSYVAAYVRLMEVYLNQEDCEKAIAAGKRAVDIGGVNGFVFRGFGLCYFLQEDFGNALNAFRIAKVFLPEDEASHYYHALSAINFGYAGEAIAILDELIKEHPDNPSYYYLQVNGYLLNDDYDSVLETLEIVRRKGTLNATAYALLGNLYINKQMPEAAAEAYVSGLKQGVLPDFSTVVEQFNHLSRLGDWQVSETYLNTVVEVYEGRLYNDDRRALEVVQARLLIDSGKPSDGAELLREVIEADPTNGDALLSLARYYRQQQDFERAGVYFQRAANEDEVALEAMMENAQLASDQENWQLAIELLTRAGETAAPDFLSVIQENIRAIKRVLDIVAD